MEQENLRLALAEVQRKNELLEKALNKDPKTDSNNHLVQDKEPVTEDIDGSGARLSRPDGTSEQRGDHPRSFSESALHVEIVNAEVKKLQRSLESERNRILDLENRLEMPLRLEHQKSLELHKDDKDRSQLPFTTSSQSETLFNVLLAEIMSLQLLYQMEDLSRSYQMGAPRSRDSGCSDYDEILLESVSTTLIEKGELILNSLRDKQRRESRVSLTSTDSFRELCYLQFPLSPKVSLGEVQNMQRFHSASLGSIKEIRNELPVVEKTMPSSSRNMGKRSSYDAELWMTASGCPPQDTMNPLSSGAVWMSTFDSKLQLSTDRPPDHDSNSSLESFCEGEPLSPRRRSVPADSGCGSQHSDWEPPVKVSGLPNKEEGCVVPLAEEEDGNIDSDEVLDWNNDDDDDDDDDDEERIKTLEKGVLHLGKDLLQLKSELDGEMISFFSDAFGVDMPLDNAKGLLHFVNTCFQVLLLFAQPSNAINQRYENIKVDKLYVILIRFVQGEALE